MTAAAFAAAAVMAAWQATGAKSDAASGRRAGICHPCQHNGSEKARPEMLPGKLQAPFSHQASN